MKSIIRAIALVALLLLTCAGCQKEHDAANQDTLTGDSAPYTVHYAVDGRAYTIQLAHDSELDSLMLELTDLAVQGRLIVVYAGTPGAETGKGTTVTTFTTESKEEASAWAAEMHRQGYTVTIGHDSDTGIYTCIAYTSNHPIISLTGTRWAWNYTSDFHGRFGLDKWYVYDTLYFVSDTEYVRSVYITDMKEEDPYESYGVHSDEYRFNGFDAGYIYLGKDENRYKSYFHYIANQERLLFRARNDPDNYGFYYKVTE